VPLTIVGRAIGIDKHPVALGNSFVEVSLVSGAVWESHEAFSIEVEGHVRDVFV